MSKALENKTILLVVSGGIAAYKSLELIRLIRKYGGAVRCILTQGGSQFVTPLSISALCEHEVYTDLWSLKDETEMGHIRLSRETDVILVAPASADFISKLAQGRADDLASTTLLAANKTILITPAMNHKMWDSGATQENITLLKQRGMTIIGPDEGDMACGEYGLGRMSEPETILDALISHFHDRPLKGLHALVTAGPTHEPVDPVRFIGNRSSGKQGYEIAEKLAIAGARVTLISGPVSIKPPEGVTLVNVQTAQDMLEACENALPADIAICAAAVSDWRSEAPANHKMKKRDGDETLTLALTKNPDILATLSAHPKRPKLVIGFSAETNDLLKNSYKKLQAKKCDWMLANDVSGGKVFGENSNHIHFLSSQSPDASDWGSLTKSQIAQTLILKIAEHFKS
jgi:phosphopantothenoylcysteine decarboxylase / phosphopantothenate---cysteine ligase